MSLPLALIDPSVGQSVLKVRKALAERLRGNWSRKGIAWNFHFGEPFRGDLSDKEYGIWLRFLNIIPNETDSPFNADYLVSTWRIAMTFPDEGTDKQGFDDETAIHLIGEIYQVLRETLNDLSLDSTLDITQPPQISNDLFQMDSGRRIAITNVTLRCHHSLQPIRPCP